MAILGGIGVSVLGGLGISILGSRLERDHSRAHEWLQSATEVLVNDVDWRDCTTTDPTSLAAHYEAELQTFTEIVPPDWKDFDLMIPVPVQYPDPGGRYGAPCDPDENRQKVLIQVRSPDGSIIETVEVVKVP